MTRTRAPLRRRPEPRPPAAQADDPRRRLRAHGPHRRRRRVHRQRGQGDLQGPHPDARERGEGDRSRRRSSPPSRCRRGRTSRSSSSTRTKRASRRSTRRRSSRPSTSRTRSRSATSASSARSTTAPIAEDLRYVNAPQFVSEVTVDAVELYTTVTEKGRPVNFLQASNFKVFEDGVVQKIEGFEYVKNLPLSVGVMIDTSASMLESLPEAEQAALEVHRLHDRRKGSGVRRVVRQRALPARQADRPQGQADPRALGAAGRGLDRALRRDHLRPLPVHRASRARRRSSS